MPLDSLKSTVDPSIDKMVAEFALAWRESPEEADLGLAMDNAQHAIQESQLDDFLGRALEELHHPPSTPDGYSNLQSRMLLELARLGRVSFDLTPGHLEALLRRGLPQSLVHFVKLARRDQRISDDEIFQASRNVAVANILQLMLDQPCEATPALFAYSMLYPYTDNYLDNTGIPMETKLAFNALLGCRLAGEKVKPCNRHEKAIFDLIGIIEGEIGRASMPRTYESLNAIHKAQSKSLELAVIKSPEEDHVLKVSIEKGGTSVLANGYLVADNELTPRQVRFMFGLGVFLQMVDDLQDLKDDRKSGNTTIFTMATANKLALESLTNRAISFGTFVMTFLDAFPAPNTNPIKEVMQLSVAKLIIGAVSLNQQYFRAEYLRNLEAHSPFRFSYLKRVKARLKQQKVSMTTLLNYMLT
jgi:hypothetical protein